MALSPDQTSILVAALAGGSFLCATENEVAKCRKLNEKGLLGRDHQNGKLWFPTDAARGLFGSENLPATVESAATSLRAMIEHAAGMLASATTAADVLDVRDTAAFAYGVAKAQGRLARAKGAHDEVCASLYRSQAAALDIEAEAKRRLADEYDAAQARGEVRKPNNEKTTSHAEVVSAGDIGLTHKEVHEARQVRDVLARDPEVVRRVLHNVLSDGDEPTRARLRRELGLAGGGKVNIGTASHSKKERGDDLYETPVEAMRTLLALESFSLNVLEPSVGRGAIMRPLEDADYQVIISDLVDRGVVTRHGECQGVGDFLLSNASGDADLVTNPPYGVANAYAAHALREHKPRKMALLLNLNFQCGYEDSDRRFVMDDNPPSRIYVFTKRLPMMHRDGWEGNKASSQMNTGWFVWERNDDGSYGAGYPRLIRVNYEDFQNAEPLVPGAGGHIASLSFKDALPDEFARSTPRKTLDERVGEEIERAILWLKEMQPFDAVILRRAIGVRPSVADALIAAMHEAGLIVKDDEGLWLATGEGLHLTAQANAVAVIDKWRAETAVTA